MILQRFGATLHAVDPDFHATAFNEIAFARRPGFAMRREEFAQQYERTGEVAVGSESEGEVKLNAEEALLELLEHRLADVERRLGPDEVLLIESQPGRDYPRSHDETETLVENGFNRLHFHYWVDPPLRLGIFRRRG